MLHWKLKLAFVLVAAVSLSALSGFIAGWIWD